MSNKRNLSVGDNCFQNLKRRISDEWKDIGRSLGFNEEQLRNLPKGRGIEGQEDINREMFAKWKGNNGENATYGKLNEALRYAGRVDLAEMLMDGKFDHRASTDNTFQASPETAGPSDTPTERASAPPAVPSTVLPSPAVHLPRYKMGNKPRGNCLILTYDEFDENKHTSRPGNVVDTENLVKTFKTLGYRVDTHTNLDKEDSMHFINKMAKGESDSFVLFVCSHGNEESFFTRDNKEIALQDTITPFNTDKCPGLARKPKIFFFNSCRGGKEDKMFKLKDCGSGSVKIGVGSNLSYYRPTQADFCVVLSTVSGYASWRDEDPTKGSYFVRNVTTTLTENYKEYHLIDILTMSNDTLLREFEEKRISSGNPDSECQVPTIISTLSKAVYFID